VALPLSDAEEITMTETHTYLAIFTGSRTSARRSAWEALSDAERRAREQAGIAAWHAWVERHREAIVTLGGPLGRTKRIAPEGTRDISNEMAAFTVVRAASHEEAARMFEQHPHFALFPGDAVEVMPVLAIPGA
jgi:hypothetical protein